MYEYYVKNFSLFEPGVCLSFVITHGEMHLLYTTEATLHCTAKHMMRNSPLEPGVYFSVKNVA